MPNTSESKSGTSGPAHMFPEQETTQYQVACPTGDWEDWKATVPRTVPLYQRIHQLLKLDTNREDSEAEGANLRLISLKFQRVEQRVENTLDALDDGDESRAREELEAIDEIARGFTE